MKERDALRLGHDLVDPLRRARAKDDDNRFDLTHCRRAIRGCFMRTFRRHLALINVASFLAQTVQIGTVPPALALRLEAAGASPASIGLVAAAPWIAILIFGCYVPHLLSRAGFVAPMFIGLALSALTLIGMGFPRIRRRCSA